MTVRICRHMRYYKMNGELESPKMSSRRQQNHRIGSVVDDQQQQQQQQQQSPTPPPPALQQRRSSSTNSIIGSTTMTTKKNWYDSEMGAGSTSSSSASTITISNTATGNNGETNGNTTIRKRRNSLTLSQIWNENKINTCKACRKVRDVLSMKSLSSTVVSSKYNCQQCDCYLCAAIATTRQQIQFASCCTIFFWLLCLLGALQWIPESFLVLCISTSEQLSSLTSFSSPPLVSVLTISFVLFSIQVLLSIKYDTLVNQRHQAITEISETSQNLVCEIYPETVRNRLMQSHTSWRTTNRNTIYDNDDVSDDIDDDIDHDDDNDNDFNTSNTYNTDLVQQQFDNRKPRRRSTGDLPFEVRSSVIKTSVGLQPPSEQETTSSTTIIPFSTTTTTGSSITMLSKPIVDNYKSATVLFADIVGFTLWSSSHDPYQVFTYLETLYAAFDAVAAEQDIFKVETIGDCYMAVSGLPRPSNDHAIRMSIFARSLLQQILCVSKELDPKLGATEQLGLRIGINSGPVTAGVLRGQKARFQLFGDTVNTASRMESTGVCCMVQLSPTTVNCILEQGGSNTWFVQRPEKINVKGKGMMDTYWLLPNEIDESILTKLSSSSTLSPYNISGTGISAPIKNNVVSSSLSTTSVEKTTGPRYNSNTTSTSSEDGAVNRNRTKNNNTTLSKRRHSNDDIDDSIYETLNDQQRHEFQKQNQTHTYYSNSATGSTSSFDCIGSIDSTTSRNNNYNDNYYNQLHQHDDYQYNDNSNSNSKQDDDDHKEKHHGRQSRSGSISSLFCSSSRTTTTSTTIPTASASLAATRPIYRRKSCLG